MVKVFAVQTRLSATGGYFTIIPPFFKNVKSKSERNEKTGDYGRFLKL